MNLITERRISANANNPAVAGPSSPNHAFAGPSSPNRAVAGSPNQSNIAQDCKDTALILWRAYQAILSGRAADEDDINRYLEIGRAALLKAQNSSQNLFVPDKQKLQAGVALINSVLHFLSDRRVGAGLNENNPAENNPTVVWDDVQSAFENRIKMGVITNRRHLDILAFMTTDLNEWFVMNVQQPIDKEMEEFQQRESGWSLKSILNLVINIYNYNPMRGSSYIDLPPFIKNKKARVNVQNDDDQCFRWVVLSALHPASININRVSSYFSYKNELNFEGIEFPIDPRKIGKFETQNDVSVNVYYLKKKGKNFDILPRHLTSCKKAC